MAKLQRYLLLLCAAILVCLLSVFAVNIYVDPYQLTRAPVHKGYDEFIPQGNASLVLNYKQQQLAVAHSSTALIGSSRTQVGYDTCDLGVYKTSMVGIDTSHVLALAKVAIDTPTYSSLVMELGGLFNTYDASVTLNSFEKVTALFSADMLYQSILKLLNSPAELSSDDTECEPLQSTDRFSENTLLRDKIKRLYHDSVFGPELTHKLSASLTQIAQFCAASGRDEQRPLRIKLIVGPLNHDIFDEAYIEQVTRLSEAAITASQHPACPVSLYMSPISEAAKDNDNWHDYMHFKKGLGTEFLQWVLAQ